MNRLDVIWVMVVTCLAFSLSIKNPTVIAQKPIFSAYIGENPNSGSTCVFFSFKEGDAEGERYASESCKDCNGGVACKLTRDIKASPACIPNCLSGSIKTSPSPQPSQTQPPQPGNSTSSRTGGTITVEIGRSSGGNFNDSFISMARAGGTTPDDLRQVLSEGANINAVHSTTGETALTAAATYSRIDSVKFLIDNGADINLPDSAGDTPLITAIKSIGADEEGAIPSTGAEFVEVLRDQYAVLRLLVSRGAKLNVKNKKGDTALSLARGSGNRSIERLLLSAGANESSDNKGKTPLAQQQETPPVVNSEGPTLEETLGFIERAVLDFGRITVESVQHKSEIKFNNCQATSTWKQFWISNQEMPIQLQDVETKFNLSDIDPYRIFAVDYEWTSAVQLVTKGKAKKIYVRFEHYSDVQKTKVTDKGSSESHYTDISVGEKENAERLVRAFKHAVTICNSSKPKDPF